MSTFIIFFASFAICVCKNRLQLFQENNGISEVFEPSALESTRNGASSSGRFGFKYPTSNTSTILRTRSATIGMLQQNRSASKQFWWSLYRSAVKIYSYDKLLVSLGGEKPWDVRLVRFWVPTSDIVSTLVPKSNSL